MSTSVVKGRQVAVYDKNNSGAGDNPEDTLDSMVEAGENVSPSDDPAAVAAQRRLAARERLEAKIAEDAAAERRRRRNIGLVIGSILVIICLIVATVLIVNKVKDDRARAEAAEAAKWSNCSWSQAEALPDLVKANEEQKKNLEEQWKQYEPQLEQMDAKQAEEARKNYAERMAELDAQIAYAPTAMNNIETKSRKVDVPANGRYPRTGKTLTMLRTSAGNVRIDLIHAHAACNDAAFQKLIQAKYFDNTSCHRMTNTQGLVVLQCGDPTGTGMGGPGFNSQDETPDYLVSASGQDMGEMQQQAVTYPKGTVAVANSGPNTGSSQFFIVLADSQLPPNYTVIGQVNPKDFPVLDKIKAYGITVAPGSIAPEDGKVTDGAPANPVTIESWRIIKTVGVEPAKNQ